MSGFRVGEPGVYLHHRGAVSTKSHSKIGTSDSVFTAKFEPVTEKGFPEVENSLHNSLFQISVTTRNTFPRHTLFRSRLNDIHPVLWYYPI